MKMEPAQVLSVLNNLNQLFEGESYYVLVTEKTRTGEHTFRVSAHRFHNLQDKEREQAIMIKAMRQLVKEWDDAHS